MKIALALVAAFLAPALLITGYDAVGTFASAETDDSYVWVRVGNFALMASYVSAAHVVVLGLPAFLLLRWKNLVRWWSAVVAGFFLGCLPVAIWAWPLKYRELRGNSSQWDGERMVQTMIDGVPTIHGWLSYGAAVTFMGAFGAIGGLAFWLVWRRQEPQPALPADRPPAERSAVG